MADLCRAAGQDLRPRIFWRDRHNFFPLTGDPSLDALMQRPVQEVRRLVEQAANAVPWGGSGLQVIKPIESQEVWAAGLTYRRSRDARIGESSVPDPYDRAYAAERPELFFKATASRVRGPGEPIAIRRDSTWDVPEPELAVYCTAALEVFGYSIGNDVSSRSIEGENPLYLPQAKIYAGSCALGPGIRPAWEFEPQDAPIDLEIFRAGKPVFSGRTSTGAMRRSIADLLVYLARHNVFPHGVILLTGTGIVPPDAFTLHEGDEVVVRIEGIGELRNPVQRG